MRSPLLVPLAEAASGHKGRNTLWDNALKTSFKELNCMLSSKMLLSYPDWKLPFTVHTDASDKQVCAFIS